MKTKKKKKGFLYFIAIVLTLVGVFSLMSQINFDSLSNGSDEKINEDLKNPTNDGELTILAIGSSYLVDTMTYVYDIAEDLGTAKIRLGNLYIGGCEIDTHLNNLKSDSPSYTYYHNNNGTWNETLNYKMSQALNECAWDYIVINQGVHASGLPNKYSNVNDYVERIQKVCPYSKIAFSMGWTYSEESTLPNFEKDYQSSVDVMYKGIINTAKTRIEPLGIEIIPCGTTIANARTSKLTDSELTRDAISYGHLNELGKYMASLTLVGQLLDKDVSKVNFVGKGISDEQKLIAIESTINSLKIPYNITKSLYQ